MNCPKCSYPNPQGVQYCQMCYEVFNRSAADRYLHAQRRARMQRDGSLPTPEPAAVPDSPVPSSQPRIIRERKPSIDWGAIFRQAAEKFAYFIRTFAKEIGIAAAIVLLGALALFYTSAGQRLQLFGNRLDYRFRTNVPVNYLILLHSNLKSWSERGGRLDTPLSQFERNETGSIRLRAAPAEEKTMRVSIKPLEWIVSQDGKMSQVVPVTHPTLKPAEALLGRGGNVTQRINTGTSRLGRVVPFVLPRWPGGTQRPGDQWEEAIEWTEVLGEWKIAWKGRLKWEMIGSEMYEGVPCIHLSYRTAVTPSLRDRPAWAKGAVGKLTYKGAGRGDLYFDPAERRIVSNDFNFDGTLSMPIDNVYRIPPDLRVGRTPRRRWGGPVPVEPGTLFIQFQNKLGIRKT